LIHQTNHGKRERPRSQQRQHDKLIKDLVLALPLFIQILENQQLIIIIFKIIFKNKETSDPISSRKLSRHSVQEPLAISAPINME
jgi:hypothetical protein